MPLMAFCVPLVAGTVCAMATEPNARATLEKVVRAVRTRRMFTVSLRILFPGFMRMITAKVEEFHLRIFVLIHVGVRRQVVRDVIKRHARSLLAQRIADE